MNAENIQSIQTQNIAPVNSPQKVLSEGSSVYIKVLKENPNGTYQVLLAGNRINIKSENPLKTGTFFHALVSSVKDGTVVLTPQKSALTLNETEKFFILQDGTPTPALMALLESRGFVPDAVTLRLINFMQQNGVKIDKAIMQKARLLAAKFPGKEKLAAEVAAFLKEKGIEPTEENIQKVMVQLLYWQESGADENSGRGQNQHKKEKTQNNLENLMISLYGTMPDAKEGLLSFLNHCSQEGDRHWIFLPYECTLNGKTGRGLIRLMLNKSLKTTEKIEITCNLDGKKYDFVVYLKQSKVKEVRFCTTPPLLTSSVSIEEKRLGELFSSGMNSGSSVTVTYSPLAYIEGLCTYTQVPFTFEEIL